MKLLTTHYQLQTKRAFTLVEILVVIGIIVVLVTAGAISYGATQKKSRDSKRKTDLKSIQTAFEQYYSINNFQYPVTSNGSLSGGLTSNNIAIINYPRDPTGGTTGYYQCTGCTVTSYSVCASLETETSGYCIQSQQ